MSHRPLTFLMAALLVGCTSTNTFTREELIADQSHSIVVHTYDGRVIRFSKGDYRISRVDPGKLAGNGKLVVNETSGSARDWEGDLTFDEIKSISYSEPTIFGAASAVFFIGLGALIILLVAYPPKMH
ncbi:MAG TPA: hypothetical protein VL633_02040 [Bacteroidota bacterium]|nr:hypothetical protein [Bacteroidota bacterium]